MDSIVLLVAALLIALVAVRHLLSKKSNEATDASLGIEGLVTHVKHELKKVDSIRLERRENALFQLKTFDLEVNFIAKRASEGSAEVNYQVVTLGGTEELSSENIQKISLHFEGIRDTTFTIGPDTTKGDIIKNKPE